ncbi:hypothetical protein CPB83DRAFT_804162 [Crepidotus variabilis]|uniref:MARVEL domain-containing protein n=1 Tax=Crepidotus variabilis TaxID=179855 RepID=A0A9P6ET27_9AGAR|nr:hypothetical protein CPB83DRAFT_804162 [Crepidotus variabilis]
MTVRFGNYRLGLYVVTLLLAGTVLGLAANFASIFLPNLHRDFTIFAIIIPSLTILVFLFQLQWALPLSEVIVLLILDILWLAMGAWSTDVIGNVQCDTLRGQTTPSKSGTTSLQAYCYEMKVIQAFSWALFGLFTIAIWILFKLIHQAQRFGRYDIWHEPIRADISTTELPWFGEMPGYYNTSNHGHGAPYPQSPSAYGGSHFAPSMPMAQPGHSLIIQPGINGAPPTVTQVPIQQMGMPMSA